MATSAKASDVALIVQGTLIFLSAVIGVLGYIVQSNMRAKERVKENEEIRKRKNLDLKVEQLRDKLSTFVGPASVLALASVISAVDAIPHYVKKIYPKEFELYVNERKKNGTFDNYFHAKWSDMFTLIGDACEQKLIGDPESTCAKHYRTMFKAALKDEWKPLAELIQKYSGHLMDWQTPDEFKKRWP